MENFKERQSYNKIFLLKSSVIIFTGSILLSGVLLLLTLNRGDIGNTDRGDIKERAISTNQNWKYALYLPANFDQNKKYPLIIGLHGGGGRASEYINLWTGDADKYSFIIAALQAYPDQYPWTEEINEFTRAVISDISESYKIDNNKIFLTGYSAGASTSYIIALTSGIEFKGIIPINGLLPPLDSGVGIRNSLNNAKGLNFYVIHGANDYVPNMPVGDEKLLIKYGAKMEFKILPGMGHEYPLLEHENIIKWIKSLP